MNEKHLSQKEECETITELALKIQEKTRGKKGQWPPEGGEGNFFPSSPEGMQPCPHDEFSVLRPILNFWSSEILHYLNHSLYYFTNIEFMGVFLSQVPIVQQQ